METAGQGQEPDRVVSLDAMGRQLSIDTGCRIRFDHAGKAFVCHCGVRFTVDELVKSGDWAWVKERHDKEGR